MTTTEALPQPAAAAASPSSPFPQRRWYIGLALLLTTLGVLLLLGNLGLLLPDARRVVDLAWGAVLVAAGLLLAATRARPTLLPLESFRISRPEVERAGLTAAMGAADLELRALTAESQLAAGEAGGPAAPRLDVRDGMAAVRLDGRRSWPLQHGARWPVAIATDIPWTLELESGLGDFDLELGDLAISALRLRTLFGQVNLSLPATGAVDLDLALGFGNLTVHVPDGMAVRLKLAAGPLSEFEHDERRFVRVGPDEWVTPLYAVAANRCTLVVQLRAGDFRLT